MIQCTSHCREPSRCPPRRSGWTSGGRIQARHVSGVWRWLERKSAISTEEQATLKKAAATALHLHKTLTNHLFNHLFFYCTFKLYRQGKGFIQSPLWVLYTPLNIADMSDPESTPQKMKEEEEEYVTMAETPSSEAVILVPGTRVQSSSFRIKCGAASWNWKFSV